MYSEETWASVPGLKNHYIKTIDMIGATTLCGIGVIELEENYDSNRLRCKRCKTILKVKNQLELGIE